MPGHPTVSSASWRIGADVGGTFTDVLLLDETSGAYAIAKTLTTPDDPSIGVLRGIRTALVSARVAPADVVSVIHGTTLVTNAIIQRTGPRTALVTTKGFRDVLDIAREHRYDMYDLLLQQPKPLVPRACRFEVDERLFADGSVYRVPSLDDVDRVAVEIQALGISSIAIVFLHSFRNPAHEKLVEALLAERIPGARISRSSEVAGEIREYERTTTTVANAYVQAALDRYLARLDHDLDAEGIVGRLFVMLSNAGLATVETARRFPVRSVESGPAAGALAASELGRASGYPNLLSFDMGGTTAKACLIENGRPFMTTELEVDRIYRFKPGSGLPIRAPSIELIEIGAGGGSIARVNQFGLIKVGPESAGASPGPACYGRGGQLPTVTDADLVLGYLNPEYFLGGDMQLDRAAAVHAIDEHIARPMGLGVDEAAWSIHQIVNENMAAAARIHAVERGMDVRAYPLFAFGGAGPVHAFRVAEILGLGTVIAPFAAGVGSTFGFLVAPVAFDFVRGAAGRLDRLDWREIDQLYREMEDEGRALLAAAGIDSHEIALERTADMRLAGQAHQISVDVPPGRLTTDSALVLQSTFSATYLGLFKRVAPDVPAEALNWRLRVSGPSQTRRQFARSTGRPATSQLKGSRAMYRSRDRGYAEVPVYDRYSLNPGDSFSGPAIVEERESTLVVGNGGQCLVDEWLNLIVTVGGGTSDG
jgi:N-methylhydantoinase A